MPDDRVLVERQLVNGKLQVTGEKHLFFQGIIRSFHITSHNLKVTDGFGIYDGIANRRPRIRGDAQIDRGDTLAIAAWAEKTTKLDLSIAPAPDDHQAAWQMVVGYLPYDWEIGNDPTWFAEVHMPQAAFDSLLSELRIGGNVTTLFVAANLDLWAQDHDQHTPPSSPVTWFLIPHDKLANSVGVGKGRISDIGWTTDKLSDSADHETEATDLSKLSMKYFDNDTSLNKSLDTLNKTLGRVATGLGVIIFLLAVIAFRL